MTLREITLAIADGSEIVENYNTATVCTPNKQIVFRDLIILYVNSHRHYFCFPEGNFNLQQYQHWKFLTTNANANQME